jgi:hypothetical protein
VLPSDQYCIPGRDGVSVEVFPATKAKGNAGFKFFKGVGSSKLYGITAIQPILQVQKNDKRFVDSHDIEFEDSTNLALMDWEDLNI